jgi:hypothetical protein
VPPLGGLEVGLEAGRAPGRAAPTSRRRRRHTRAPGTSYTARGSREGPTSAIASTNAYDARAAISRLRRRNPPPRDEASEG